MTSKKEQEYYTPVMVKLRQLFESRGAKVYLEVTARRFSNHLKGQVPQHRNIIFSFLGSARPDITGFVERQYSKDFIVVEVKDQAIKLPDIYQLRRYTDLFDARFAFAVSTVEIPAEIKALAKVVMPLLLRNYPLPNLALTHFDPDRGDFSEWFDENPFDKDYYWR